MQLRSFSLITAQMEEYKQEKLLHYKRVFLQKNFNFVGSVFSAAACIYLFVITSFYNPSDGEISIIFAKVLYILEI